ncbi:hypothetical protein ABBQ38_008937 [Trebouxia sp. C0009 RCD-2024]
MTTPSQLGTLRGEIDDIKAKILKTEEALAAAEALADISFWRKRLGDLDKEKIILREQETILLQGQASDEEQEIWLPACFAIPWLIGQQVRQQKQQLHQTKENGHKMQLKKFH